MLTALRRPAEVEPKFADEAFCEGVLAQIAGDVVRAAQCYRLAVEIEPAHQGALHHLALVLAAQDDGAGAVRAIETALSRFPNSAELWLARGSILHGLARYPDAICAFERALSLQSPYPEADNLLGATLLTLDRPMEASEHFEAAIRAAPDLAEAHSNLGASLLALGRPQEAISRLEHAIRLKPDYGRAMRNLGAALLDLERENEALAWFQSAIVLTPDDATLHYDMGISLAKLGRMSEAVAALDRAIELQPGTPGFYRVRGRFGFDARHAAALDDLALDEARLSEKELIELRFAQATAAAARSPRRAIRYWIDGNALKRRSIVYDEPAVLGLMDQVRETFTADLMQRWSGSGHPSRRPVFIVGMPRSGSTLIEQILASHPKIFGAGEVSDFPEAVARMVQSGGRPLSELMQFLTDEHLCELGASYDGRLGAYAPDASLITDKMLANFRFAGLIHLALPHARIIHARRDPVDSCLSCFTELFAAGQSHTYDLGELGRYYAAYQRLMAHWRTVLPEDVMIDIDYEALATDTEVEARRMVAHLGLEWDDACLAFHRSGRPVRTASMAQVRRPVYRDSIGRAEPYRPDLGPLLEALGIAA